MCSQLKNRRIFFYRYSSCILLLQKIEKDYKHVVQASRNRSVLIIAYRIHLIMEDSVSSDSEERRTLLSNELQNRNVRIMDNVRITRTRREVYKLRIQMNSFQCESQRLTKFRNFATAHISTNKLTFSVQASFPMRSQNDTARVSFFCRFRRPRMFHSSPTVSITCAAHKNTARTSRSRNYDCQSRVCLSLSGAEQNCE